MLHKRRFRLPSPALVISMVTLCLVLGGTAVAATTEKHSDVRADTKLVKSLAPSLSVRSSKHADVADSTGFATNATKATTADDATSLGGLDASQYMRSGVVQHGTVILNAGTTGHVLFGYGPLSVTADCTLSAGTLTVNVNTTSTVGNWLHSATVEANPGSVVNDTRNDGGSGTFSGSTGSVDFMSAQDKSGVGPRAIRGQDAYGVNWPSAGKCYVSASVVTMEGGPVG